METGKLLAAGALALVLSAGLAQAKIPVPPMDDAAKAKAEAAKVKAADAAKKDAELLAKSQDRVVERYKKGQVKGGKPAPAAKGAKPAVASTKK
jgi:succinyl-CoA synthetase beta subunit